MRLNRAQVQELLWTAAICVLALAAGYLAPTRDCAAAEPPAIAHRYRADLVRSARLSWGLDAPVPVFAAQIHAESAWRPDAVSRVGAEGMAQFMPTTATWWCELNHLSPAECQPRNPTWAMRALTGYDRWLWSRIGEDGACDHMWATLRAYNGGLGHWLAEARKATGPGHAAVDAACGSARRSAAHCPENLAYPRRILQVLQPRYAAWGPGIACGASS